MAEGDKVEFDINRDLKAYTKTVRAIRHESPEAIILNDSEVAQTGDWLVWEDGAPRVVSPEEFAQYYDEPDNVADRFHRLLYANQLGSQDSFCSWRGVPIVKNPLDMMIYAEIIHREEPEVIVETGTCSGASAQFFQDMMDLGVGGNVITVELTPAVEKYDPRITYIEGSSSTSSSVVGRIREMCEGKRTMVSLDSDHKDLHVFEEMEAYGPLVTSGQYMVVEDTNTSGHPVDNGPPGTGPWQAVEWYFEKHDDFERDPECERYGITFHPGGWLRKL